MARILYGICRVGRGHLTRSKIVIDYLIKKGHTVMILSGGKNYEYLKSKYQNVLDVGGLELEFKKNKISSFGTILKNLKKITIKGYKTLKNKEQKILEFKPTIAISDWEPYTGIISHKYKIPLISYDNQHYLNYGTYKVQKKEIIAYLKARPFLNLLIKKPKHMIILTLPGMKIEPKNNSTIINPVIRDEIRKAKTKKEEHILVYHSIGTNKKLISQLKRINIKFIVYGFEKNEKEFIKDLINARAVICSGGFTLISEAIYLKKPLLVIPITEHFEQLLNARHIKEQGYGGYTKILTEESIINFLAKLKGYKRQTYTPGNEKLYKTLDTLIK